MNKKTRVISNADLQTLKSMATSLCANYRVATKECCLTDRRCSVIDKETEVRTICRYFKKSVLPENPTLEAKLLGWEVATKKCEICGRVFVPGSNRQSYCSDECESKGNRAKSRERMRKMREKKDEEKEREK